MEIRAKIIEAAKRRFTHYGYQKTTMAEVAEDCGMSPGNLYRYFAGKIEIAEEICREASLQTAEELRQTVALNHVSAAERLKAFLFQDLRTTFRALEKDPKIVQMAQIVTSERPQFHNEGLKRERAVLREIIEAGNASGEFRVAEPEFAAEMIQAATMKFSYPQLFTRLSLERLERELDGVYRFILGGLQQDMGIVDPAPALAPADSRLAQTEHLPGAWAATASPR